MSVLLDNAVGELSKLPGIGKRTALRLAMTLLRWDRQEVVQLSDALRNFRCEIKRCRHCNNLSDTEECGICSDSTRDRSTICVVQGVGDLMSIEATGQYHGLYHVLGGVLSPMQGISPRDLKIDLLTESIERNSVKEVIIAIGTTVECETTLFYIARCLEKYRNLRITTIARGIGFGDEIEYADELTITHAMQNRTTLQGM